MSYCKTPEGRDPQLWNTARKRASFKSHLTTYIIVNAGLWIIWYFSETGTYSTTVPWPAWSMVGWGIGLASHYVSAYVSSGVNAVEREYNKLSQKQPQ